MRRVFIVFVVFLAALLCLDFIVGSLSRPFLKNEPDAGNNHSNLKQSLFNKEADLIVLGASKSNHHYITDSLQHYFNLSVCNLGMDGDNIVTSSIQFDAMLERQIPRIVIIDLSGGQLAGDWKSVVLTHKCYYGVNSVYTNALNELLPIYDRVKLFSGLYRMNEEIRDLIQSYVIGDRNNQGFIPLIGSAPNLSHIVKGDEEDEYKIGEVQRKCLDRIIDRCHDLGIELFLVYSPTLISYNNRIAQVIGHYCEEKGCIFFNYEGDERFLDYPDLFKDYNHLNLQGAQSFTTDIIDNIMSRKGRVIK